MNILWVLGGLTAGFFFSKAMYAFAEFMLQAIKNSGEND
jgi:hypothetical protein